MRARLCAEGVGGRGWAPSRTIIAVAIARANQHLDLGLCQRAERISSLEIELTKRSAEARSVQRHLEGDISGSVEERSAAHIRVAVPGCVAGLCGPVVCALAAAAVGEAMEVEPRVGGSREALPRQLLRHLGEDNWERRARERERRGAA